MPKTIYISPDTLKNTSLKALIPLMYTPEFRQNMLQGPGREHYYLLAEVSLQLDAGAAISDVGTCQGASALALSLNENVSVVTYDIVSCIPASSNVKTPLDRPNIKQKIMPGQDDIATIAKSDVVLLDISPHSGPDETTFVNQLIEHKFRGLLLCDDIFLSPDMKQFWNNIPQNLHKIDLTAVGHYSGSGCVIFDKSFIDLKYTPPYTII